MGGLRSAAERWIDRRSQMSTDPAQWFSTADESLDTLGALEEHPERLPGRRLTYVPGPVAKAPMSDRTVITIILVGVIVGMLTLGAVMAFVYAHRVGAL